MNDTKVLERLKAYVEMCGSQVIAAEKLNISSQYMNDLLRGRRSVSENIANKFGFTAMWVEYGKASLLTQRAADLGVCPGHVAPVVNGYCFECGLPRTPNR
jgi:hypothetical protein